MEMCKEVIRIHSSTLQ